MATEDVMFVLHVLSNWKWTERSEPAALLARAQQADGIDVHFACDRGPSGAKETVADHVDRFGLPFTATHLPKHTEPLATWRGVRALRKQLKMTKPDVVHCHLPNAHLIAALAARGLQPASLLVRSCYDHDARELGLRERFWRRPFSDGVVVIGETARSRVERLGFPPEQIAVIEPGIDLDRFAPGCVSRSTARQRWGISDTTFVIGLVTRIRRDRGTGLAVELLQALKPALPHVCVLLVGRGSPDEVRQTITEPAARLGVNDRLIMAGYQTGGDLVAAYRAMDVLLYPRPGTDRSCRTVREAMAAGLPVIAGNEGVLPDLVTAGKTGLIAELSAETLAAGLVDLARDPGALKRMAAAALQAARRRFDLTEKARLSADFYRRLQNLSLQRQLIRSPSKTLAKEV